MNNEKCSVCDKVLDINVYLTKCSHIFHYSCIKFCLDKYRECPVCDQGLTLLDIENVDVLNAASRIKKEETMPAHTETQNKNWEKEVRPISAKGSKLYVDNSDRRVRDNESKQGPSKLPSVNIYNHSGNVIVCDTYEPKTFNAFGFGKSYSSAALENEQQKKSYLERCLNYVLGKSSDNGSSRQLECKNQNEVTYPEEHNISKTSNQLRHRNEESNQISKNPNTVSSFFGKSPDNGSSRQLEWKNQNEVTNPEEHNISEPSNQLRHRNEESNQISKNPNTVSTRAPDYQ